VFCEREREREREREKIQLFVVVFCVVRAVHYFDFIGFLQT